MHQSNIQRVQSGRTIIEQGLGDARQLGSHEALNARNRSVPGDPSTEDRDAFIAAMRGAVTGVNVITTDGPAGRLGLTVSAFASVSADPPTVLVCINRTSPVAAAIRDNGCLCVNVLSTEQRVLADTFAGRPHAGAPYDFGAADADDSGTFVAENYAELRSEKFFSAGIPTKLGGGGATYAELCDVVRTFGQHCGSTALAYAMHSHPIQANVFKYRRGDLATANVLEKLAGGELAVANTGANDWLGSSGNARAVEGGYRINARKRFVSGGPGADLLITSAACTRPDGDEVLHFAVPMTTDGIEIADNWRTLGMRGTGSNDVVLDDVFVPDAAIVARRPAGEWHPLWDAVIPTALPLITAAYVGLAESAAKLAVDAARRQPQNLAAAVGEMLNELSVAQLALADMARLNNDHGFEPSLELTDAIFARKAIAARAVKAVVEIAAELVGGPGYLKGHALERIVRDIRAMDFHPLPVRRQRTFRGRVALGLDPIDVG